MQNANIRGDPEDANDGGGIMRSTSLAVILLACNLSHLCGCASHNVKYDAFIKHRIEPVEYATTVVGQFDEAKALFEKARLPHNTVRQRYNLQRQASRSLRLQLGSEDYILIGEIYGGGNAYANLVTLKEAFCKKAAKKGGNVVMIIGQSVQERPFVYTTPGHSTTNVYGSAYRVGNYAYGSATSYTTYSPGQTYSGTLYFPQANGLVFRFVPGIEAKRRKMVSLSDPQLERAMAQVQALHNTKSLTLKEALRQWDSILAEAKQP